ncbi:hypothetical protein [Imbroritus primus]|uniref:hypothetical protein n=1 Tax=Imbroritus primus TaxID=3058603 RepID=UPI003D1604E6
MKPDQIVADIEAVYFGVSAIETFSRLLTDAGHAQMPAQDVGMVLDYMAQSLCARMDAVNIVFRDSVLPFYRDFQSAKEAMRGSVKA